MYMNKTISIVSETLCTHLWNHAVVDLAKKKIRACCKTPSIQLTNEDISHCKTNVFLNLDSVKADRQLMLDGGKPERCKTCWDLEDTGAFSFRDGSRDWHKYFDQLKYNNYTESHHPDNLDIQLDNYCDLKCLYCNEEFSSQWQAEKQKFESLDYINIDKDYDEFKELFFEWFPTVKQNFKRIAFLGGEPLISPTFYEYLDRIIELYRDEYPEELEFNIITNLNTNKNYFDKFLKVVDKLKDKIKFNINVSMEAYGPQAEAIRHGVNYERFKQNFETLAQIKGITLSTITTVNVLSLSTLHLYLDFLLKLEDKYDIDIIFYPNLVSFPNHLQVSLLPTDLGNQYIDYATLMLLDKNHDGYVDFLNTLRTKFNFEELKGSEQHLALITELDKLSVRRNINYKEIFTEYEYIWS